MKRQLLHLRTVGIILSTWLLCSQQCYQCVAKTTNLSAGRALHRLNEELMMTPTPSSRLQDESIINNNNLFPKRSSFHDSNMMLQLVFRGGTISSTSQLLSTITTITTQTLNIAIAAMVASGYVGCWIASCIIQQLQHYCTLIDTTSSVGDSETTVPSFLLGKYKWTFLASISYILWITINKNNTSFANNQPLFVPTLWIYSYLVNNPTLGGLIGCTHLLLGGLSNLLGSRWVVDRLGDLMEFRLPPLNDDDGENNEGSVVSYVLPTNDGEGASKQSVGNMLVRVLSSCSIFTSFPRDCLSLYLGGCAFLTWALSFDLINNNSNEGIWRVVGERWLPWWKAGLSGDASGKAVTARLFALHCIVMLIKGATALLLKL